MYTEPRYGFYNFRDFKMLKKTCENVVERCLNVGRVQGRRLDEGQVVLWKNKVKKPQLQIIKFKVS